MYSTVHGHDRAEHSLFHRVQLCAKATRLYAHAETLLVLDRPILSRPLTTLLDLIPTKSLETWISQAEPTLLTNKHNRRLLSPPARRLGTVWIVPLPRCVPRCALTTSLHRLVASYCGCRWLMTNDLFYFCCRIGIVDVVTTV
jgi:hypothetical protein